MRSERSLTYITYLSTKSSPFIPYHHNKLKDSFRMLISQEVSQK